MAHGVTRVSFAAPWRVTSLSPGPTQVAGLARPGRQVVLHERPPTEILAELRCPGSHLVVAGRSVGLGLRILAVVVCVERESAVQLLRRGLLD